MITIRGQRRGYLERRRIGRREYFLLEQVGGPFRESYRAFDPLAGPGGDFFLVQRLVPGPGSEQRLRVLKRMKSDGFPRCVEWQRRSNFIDLVLSWTDGILLRDYLDNIRRNRRPPIAPGEAIRLIQGLANAVCQLHQAMQVTHGDIQPANLILSRRPSRLRLIDFGSAWVVEMTAHRVQGDGHHRVYAAPELQIPGSAIAGFHADQFSVSVILYELLTGNIPYEGLGGKAGRGELASQTQRVLSRPSKVTTRCGRLPGSLRDGVDRITARGLALNPDDRYPDCHAWLNDLFEVSARFRFRPEMSMLDRIATQVIGWFSSTRGTRTRKDDGHQRPSP